MKVFVLFSESQLKFFGLWAEKKQGCQKAIFTSKKHFEENRLSEKLIVFIVVPAPAAAFIQIFREKKRGCRHDYTLCPVDRFEENYVFWEILFFFQIKFGLWAKISDFSWQTHGMVVRTAFYAP